MNIRYQLRAPLRRRAAQVHRPEIPGYGRRSRDRQPGARSHFQIHGRRRSTPRATPSRIRSAAVRRRAWAAISTSWCNLRRWSSRTPSTTTTFCKARSRSSTRSCSASSCRRRSLPPSIGRPSSSTSSRNTRFRVAREAEESKRKQIEANGIAAFQQTVSQGISDSYLRWRGIEATLALAQSQNSKIVVIGGGKDGLPIILNAETAAPEATPPSGANGTPPPATPAAPTESAPGSPSGGSSEAAPPAKSSNPACRRLPTRFRQRSLRPLRRLPVRRRRLPHRAAAKLPSSN